MTHSGIKSGVGNPREDDTVQIEKKWIPRWTTKWDPLRSEILSAREEQTPLVYSTTSTEVSEEEPEGANGIIELEPAQLAKMISPVLSTKRMAHRQSPTIFTRYEIFVITNFLISYYVQLLNVGRNQNWGINPFLLLHIIFFQMLIFFNII